MIISTLVTRDRFSRNKVMGFLFAVLGGLVMVLLPNLNNNTNMNFGIVPVILMLIHVVCANIVSVIFRKENERGTPILAVFAPIHFVWAIVGATTASISGDIGQIHDLTINNLLFLTYLGIIISVAYNAIFTKYYERAGTTSAATIEYLKKSLTILTPMIILGEMLSWEIALGAAFIVTGVIFTRQSYKSRRRKR